MKKSEIWKQELRYRNMETKRVNDFERSTIIRAEVKKVFYDLRASDRSRIY